jgi:tripartite-type tricarboxylate transporter receptor subunit TctC
MTIGEETHMTRTLARLALSSIALVLALMATAGAQNYPNQPIRIIVTSGAGGFTDLIARLYGQKLSERTGQNVIVENVTGAAGLIATDRVAKSAPDGYTLVMASPGPVSVGPYLRKAPYDPLKDLVPVALMATTPTAIAVNASLVPVQDLKEFIAFAKTKPGQITYSSPGHASLMHLGGELLQSMAGISLVHVPYRGTVPGIAALLAGDVQAAFGDLPALFAISQSDKGKVRILALVDPVRSGFAPDLPTVTECCLPGYDAGGWGMLLAPAGTPKAVLDFLNAEARVIYDMPDIKKALNNAAIDPAVISPEESQKFLKAQNEKWSGVIRAANITLKTE